MELLNKIQETIKNKIINDEKIGEYASGSGHLSYINYRIEKIYNPVKAGDNWKVEYEYIISITTEFTYYPDNPPVETKYKKCIIINKNGEIISEEN